MFLNFISGILCRDYGLCDLDLAPFSLTLLDRDGSPAADVVSSAAGSRHFNKTLKVELKGSFRGPVAAQTCWC